MGIVTENMQGAIWLPRFADFEAYTRIALDDCKSSMSPEDSAMSPRTETSETPAGLADVILGDRTNVPELDVKPPPIDKRRAKRSSKASIRPESVGRPSADDVTPYKPRRSKYDVKF